MKPLGMLFGAKIFVETDSDDIARECQKWLEMLDMRYRRAGEEKIRTDMAKFAPKETI